MEITEICKNKMQLLQKIATFAKKYVEPLDDIITSFDANLYAKILANCNTIIEKTKSLDLESTEINVDFVKKLIDVYTIFNTCESLIPDVVTVVNNKQYLDMYSTGVSESLVSNMKMERKQIADSYESYNELLVTEKKSWDLLKPISTSGEQIYDYIVESGVTNKLVIRLLSFIIDNLSGKKLEKLEKFIDSLKDAVLGTEKPIKVNYVTNLPKYGLTICSDDMDLDKHTLDKSYNLLKIWKVSKRAVTFNPLPLMDADYIASHGWSTNDYIGLNTDVVKRFSNIVAYKNDEEKYSIEYNDNNSLYTHILETENGTTWHILGHKTSNNGNGKVGGNNKDAVSRLISDKMVAGISMRDEQYNKLQLQQLETDMMHNPVQLKTWMKEFETVKKNLGDIHTMRNHMINQFGKHIQSYLGENSIKNVEEFRDTLLDEDIVGEIVSDELFSRYSIDYSDYEDALSFLSQVQNTVDEFYRQLGSNCVNLSSQLPDFSTDRIVSVYKKIITQTIDDLDQPPSKWRTIEVTLKGFITEKLA